jgi:hypothetical protein
MKRVVWVATGMLALAVFGIPASPRAQSGGAVKMDIVVTEKDGKPIADLKQDELQIEDDGKKVEIAGFTPVKTDTGRTVVVLLDDTAVAAATQPIQILANTMLRTAAPGDKISIVRFHNTGDTDTIAFDPQAVGARLGSFQAGVIPYAQVTTPDELLDTVAKIAASVKEPVNQRKAIVCVGAPAVCATPARSKNDEGKKWLYWTKAVNSLAASNVSVYAFMPVATTSFDGSLVDFSGGTAFTNSQDFTPFAQRIWSELGTHYMVEYPAQPGQKDVRSVTVKTTRKNAVVHTRKQR